MAKGRTKKVIDITPVEEEIRSNELVKHIQDKNLPEAVSNKIIEILSPVFIQLKDWDQKVESIVIVDENDKNGMLIASESRKFVKASRIDIKKQVDEQVALLKEEMQPYLDNIEGWKTVFQFAEAIMKSIEFKALEKEKYAENLKKQKVDDLRNKRAIIAEPLKKYIGFSLDFGIISEEEFEKVIHNAKLSEKADLAEKQAEAQRILDREKELELEKRYTNRLNMIYSLGMQKGDNTFFYAHYIVLEDTIKNTEDFDTLFSGIESKVNEIKKIEKDKIAEEERIKKEAADAEIKRIQDESEKARIATENKRIFINNRISQINGATIKQDGLYVKFNDDQGTTNFLITYDEIYTMSEDTWISFVSTQNESWYKYNKDFKSWKNQQEEIRIANEVKLAAERKIEEDNALALKQQQLAEKVQAEMSDKEKVDALITEINNFTTNITNNFVFKSEYGNTIKKNVLTLFSKIIDFIKQKK